MTNIIGLEKVSSTLHLLPGKVRRKVLRGALHSGGAIVVKRARENLGRTRKVKTGRLRKGLVKRSSLSADRKGMILRIGPTKETFYARFLEKGTKTIAAKPFLRPALDETQNEVIKQIEKKIWAGIKRNIK